MIKKIIAFSFVFVLLLVVAGCGKQEQTNINQEQKQTNQGQESQLNPGMNWEGGFDKLSLNDIVVGQKVMIMGAEDENKIVTAGQIFVGDGEVDFEQMGRGIFTRQGDNPTDGDNEPQDSQQGTQGSNQRQNMERFQNMSEEDRAKLREEMIARGGGASGGMTRTRTAGQGMVRVTGEVLSKDETSLTLKVDEGGSKLVFVSGETMVLKPKKQEVN